MKNLIYGLFALLLVVFAISACNKLNDPSVKAGQLVASKYQLKINEPDSLLLVGADTTHTISWSVTPAGFDSLVTLRNKGLIKFTKAGSYVVKTIDNGKSATTASITVSDSVYQPAGRYVAALTGDQITLVPHYYHNAAADSSYLYFVAETSKSYCATGSFYLSWGPHNGGYNINLMGIVQNSPCTGSQAPINGIIYLTQNDPAILPNGTTPLSVVLNGTTYTGSMVVTATAISFNWDYNAGVLISPKQVSK